MAEIETTTPLNPNNVENGTHRTSPDGTNNQIERWVVVCSIGLAVLIVGLFIWLFIVCRYYVLNPPQDTIAFITGAIGILAFGAASVYTIFAIKQWKEIHQQAIYAGEQTRRMAEQLAEMKAQRELANHALAQTGSMAIIMRDQATYMIQQATIMEGQLGEMKKSTEGSEMALIFSQRAYVTASINAIIFNNERSEFRLCIDNKGNTPANDIVICWNIEPLEEAPECCKAQPKGAMIVSDIGKCDPIGLIAPQDHIIFTIPFFAPRNVNAQKWDDEVIKLYCWGSIQYTDIFRDGRRKSQFAFVQSANDIKGSQCENGNEAF